MKRPTVITGYVLAILAGVGLLFACLAGCQTASLEERYATTPARVGEGRESMQTFRVKLSNGQSVLVQTDGTYFEPVRQTGGKDD